MAIVRHLEKQPLTIQTVHSETECTYSILTDSAGERCLQIDTYGSTQRKLRGKKSQSIRFTPSAANELRKILTRYF